jgi:O-antigen ligase
MRTAARASLVLLALLLPFEPRQPLARLGPLELTLVELALYAAIALGAAAIAVDFVRCRGRVTWRDAARRHAVAIAWLLALALSAAGADLARAEALKFALRAAGGIALYVVAAASLQAPAAALAVAGAVVAGAAIAALAMCAEIHVAGAAAALAPFHTRTFEVLGLPRASGPFQYPNIAAMYLEAALPLAIAVGTAIDARRRVAGHARAIAGSVGGAVVAVLLAYALSLTASRAALVTAGVVLAGAAAYARWRRAPSRWPAAVALAATALIAAAGATAGPLGSLRLQFWKDAVWYRSQIVPAAPFPAVAATGATTTFDVDVTNTGARAWPALGAHRVALSYHWLDALTGRMIVFEGERTALPRDLAPGDGARLHALVVAPDGPGRYRVQIQMLHEGITWFDERGDAGYQAVVDVSPATAPPTAPAPPSAPEAAVPSPMTSAPRAQLWRATLMAWRDHPLTGLGPDNFRRAYGTYIGLANPDPRLHANNLYLETLADLGLLGTGALLLTITAFVRAGRRALRLHGAASPAGLLAGGACAALAAYLVHGFVDYFLEFTPTYALLWLLGGMVTALGGDEGLHPAPRPS